MILCSLADGNQDLDDSYPCEAYRWGTGQGRWFLYVPSMPLVIPDPKEGMKTTRVAVHVLVYDTHVWPNWGSCCLVVK